MLESQFQSKLIKRIKDEFPGSVVIKSDANYMQGFPDLIVLYGSHWAALECKQTANASHRPNQEYYVDILGSMSFSAFIFPENEEEVLNAMARSFKDER